MLPTLGLGFLALLPLRFMEVPLDMATLKGWHAKQIVKYFSFKVSFVEALPENKAHILVREVSLDDKEGGIDCSVLHSIL